MWLMWEGHPWEGLASPPCSPGPFTLLCFHIPQQRLELGARGCLGSSSVGVPALISTPGQLHWELLLDVEAARMDQPHHSPQVPLDCRVNMLRSTCPFPPS